MTGETIQSTEKTSSFDHLVLLIVVILALLVALLIWRGDRAGVSVTARSPAPSAADASGLASVRLRFGQAMDTGAVPDLQLELAGSGAVTGTVYWEDDSTLALRPATPLLPETTYTVRLPAGAQSVTDRPLRQEQRWQFTTRSLRILYLDWDEQDRVQLYAVDLGGGEPQQLTSAPLSVLDYALAPDGGTIVYSDQRQGGGSNLWQLSLERVTEGAGAQLLLDCGGDQCSGPSWDPQGRRLVYERRSFFSPDAPPGPPRLWWLDPQTAETTPLFDDSQLLGHTARFAGNGRWLSYIVPLEQAMQVYNFETGEVIRLANEIGEPSAWHPWRAQLLSNNIQYQGESFSVHIFRLDLPAGELTNLSSQSITNDAAPAWSPSGDWIAFGRKVPRAPVGRQLWLMRPDGSQETALTDDLSSNFGPPSWSPSGQQILVQRFSIEQPDSDPGIWLVDVDDGELHQVAGSGFQPSWLP